MHARVSFTLFYLHCIQALHFLTRMEPASCPRPLMSLLSKLSNCIKSATDVACPVAVEDESFYADVPARFEAGTPPIAQAVGLGARSL